MNLACLGMNVAATGSFYFWWVSPAVLALYFVGHVSNVPSKTGTLETCPTTAGDA